MCDYYIATLQTDLEKIFGMLFLDKVHVGTMCLCYFRLLSCSSFMEKRGHSKHKKKKDADKAVEDVEQSICEKLQSRVVLTKEEVQNDFPVEPARDDAWSIETFKQKLQVKVVKMEKDDMEFDVIGIDSSLANAFRRIMLAEVPSMAVDRVFIYNNTSVIQDEVLAHRLGLIPFKADHRLFEMHKKSTEKVKDSDEDAMAVDQDTLVFKLQIKCKKNSRYKSPAADVAGDDMYVDHKVYSRHIEWVPVHDQRNYYKASNIGPICDDILIAKLRPGQEVDVVMHCVKGIAKDHVKFQSVATASYRLLPEIILKKPVTGEMAHRLKVCFPKGVIKVDSVSGEEVARVANSRRDTCSREVLRHSDLKECVELTRVKDHFIFTVESVGALPPNVIFTEAVDILMQKCQTLIKEIDQPSHSN